jgi:hypothetical protein
MRLLPGINICMILPAHRSVAVPNYLCTSEGTYRILAPIHATFLQGSLKAVSVDGQGWDLQVDQEDTGTNAGSVL